MTKTPAFKLSGRVAEPFPNDLFHLVDDDERTRVRHFDDFLERRDLALVDDHIEHVLILLRIVAVAVDNRRRAAERLRQHDGELFLFVADDRDGLADVESLGDEVDHPRTDDDGDERIEDDLFPEEETRGGDDDGIDDEHRHGDAQMKIPLHEPGDDDPAPGRPADTEHHTDTDSNQNPSIDGREQLVFRRAAPVVRQAEEERRRDDGDDGEARRSDMTPPSERPQTAISSYPLSFNA